MKKSLNGLSTNRIGLRVINEDKKTLRQRQEQTYII